MLTVFGWRDWIQCIANCCDAAVYSQNVYYYLAKSFPWVWLIHCTSGKMQIYMIILYEQLCLNVLNIVPHTNNWFRLWWGENSGKWKICAAFVGNWTLSCQLNYNNWAPTSPHNPAQVNASVVFPALTILIFWVIQLYSLQPLSMWQQNLLIKKNSHQEKNHVE